MNEAVALERAYADDLDLQADKAWRAGDYADAYLCRVTAAEARRFADELEQREEVAA